jgi:methylenetetrahydrofolate reductase (NADPH)
MPVGQKSRVGFACACKVLRDDTASIKAFGLDVVTDLCDQLRLGGAPGLHFYTMNQSAAVTALCKALSLA